MELISRHNIKDHRLGSPDWGDIFGEMDTPLTLRDRRQLAGGLVAIMFTAGGTWLAASQSFVTVKSGKLIHPSPWNLWLGLCLGGVIIGLYMYSSTFWQRLLPQKLRYVNLEAQYTLGLDSCGFDPNQSKTSDNYSATFFIRLVNGGTQVLETELESFTALANGKAPTSKEYGVVKHRILPGHTKMYRTALIEDLPKGVVLEGRMSYSVLYGYPSQEIRFRRTHSVSVFSEGEIPLREGAANIYFQDEEEETDSIVVVSKRF